MSNIAGKTFAMNVITPIKGVNFYINKVIFWFANTKLASSRLGGLATLSLIHYARWVLIGKDQFPHLHPDQPKEDLHYNYMLFHSNFNGSWDQYVDSFHKAIPKGLDLLWRKNVKYPGSVPLQPFHAYINFNQIWTSHYYSAYPSAAVNDVKSAKKVKTALVALTDKVETLSDQAFKAAYDEMLIDLQHDVSVMEDTPVVSLASQAVKDRRAKYQETISMNSDKVIPIQRTANK